MVPQMEKLKSTAHSLDAQTILINGSLEPELGPAALENLASLQIREGKKQSWP